MHTIVRRTIWCTASRFCHIALNFVRPLTMYPEREFAGFGRNAHPVVFTGIPSC